MNRHPDLVVLGRHREPHDLPTENLLGRVVGPLGLVVQLDDDDLLTVRRNPERQLGPGGLVGGAAPCS